VTVALVFAQEHGAGLEAPAAIRSRLVATCAAVEMLCGLRIKSTLGLLLDVPAEEPPSFLAWWRDFALRLVADLCALGETAQADERRDFPAPAASVLTALIDKAPPIVQRQRL
jgi:hypothetical protein